jgi:hypothetical protein
LLAGSAATLLSSCSPFSQAEIQTDLSGASPFESEAAVCVSLASSAALRSDDHPISSLRVVVDSADQEIGQSIVISVKGRTLTSAANDGPGDLREYRWQCEADYSLDGLAVDARITEFVD